MSTGEHVEGPTLESARRELAQQIKDATAGARGYLIQRLTALPGEIASAERVLLIQQRAVLDAKDALAAREGALRQDPETITGTNDKARDAQVREHTAAERERVRVAQQAADEHAIELRRLQNELSSLRSITRIVAGGGE